MSVKISAIYDDFSAQESTFIEETPVVFNKNKLFTSTIYLLILIIFSSSPFSAYPSIYFICTFSWTHGIFSTYVCCFLVVLSCTFLDILTIPEISIGFVTLDTTGVVVASIYCYIITNSPLPTRIVLTIMRYTKYLVQTYLAIFMFVTAFLSLVIPAQYVIYFLKPIIDSFIELTRLHDKRSYLGSSKKEISKNIKTYEKVFFLATSLTTVTASTMTICNNSPGLILNNIIFSENTRSYYFWYSITVPLFVCTFVSIWYIVQKAFIGHDSVYKYLRNYLIYSEEKSENKKKQELYEKNLKTAYNEYSPITKNEKVLSIFLIFLLIAGIFRRPWLMLGWSNYVIDAYGLTNTSAIYGQFSYNFIAAFTVLLFFFAPIYKITNINPIVDTSGKSPSSESLTNSLSQLDWHRVKKVLAWKTAFCLGASNQLRYCFYVSEFYKNFPPCFASLIKPLPPILRKLCLFFVGLVLSNMNVNDNVTEMMKTIVQWCANLYREGVSDYLRWAFIGTRGSYLSVFSSISNLILYNNLKVVTRKDLIVVGFPLVILHSFFSILLLLANKDQTEPYDPDIYAQDRYRLLIDWQYDPNF